jgi:hypothetical protein
MKAEAEVCLHPFRCIPAMWSIPQSYIDSLVCFVGAKNVLHHLIAELP